MHNTYFLSVWFFVLWMSNGVLKVTTDKNHSCFVCEGEADTTDSGCFSHSSDALKIYIQPCSSDDSVCQSVFGKNEAGGKKTIKRSCLPKTDQGIKPKCFYSSDKTVVTCTCGGNLCNVHDWTNDPAYKPLSSDSSWSIPSTSDYQRKADASLTPHNETATRDAEGCNCHEITRNILILVILLCVTTAFCIGAVHFCHYKYETKRLRYEMQELTPATPVLPPVPPPPGPLRIVPLGRPVLSAHSDLRFVSQEHKKP